MFQPMRLFNEVW